jgi:hypothetical protein
MTRHVRLLSLAAAALLVVAACGSATPATTTPTDAPTAAPATPAPSAAVVPTGAPASEAPGGSDLDLGGAAGALDDIEKYQIDMTISGLVPGVTDEITMTGIIDQPNDAYQLEMTGFSAIPGAAAFSLIVIGNDAWMDAGGTGYMKQPGGATAFDSIRTGFAPGALLTSVPTTGIGWNKIGDETKNGVGTGHYHVDAGTVPAFAAELGSDAAMDIWLADDGGYLVSMILTGTQAGAAVSMSMDLSRVNDASISIEAPN